MPEALAVCNKNLVYISRPGESERNKVLWTSPLYKYFDTNHIYLLLKWSMKENLNLQYFKFK